MRYNGPLNVVLAALFLLSLFLSEFVGALWGFVSLLRLGNYIDVTEPHSSQRTAGFTPYVITKVLKTENTTYDVKTHLLKTKILLTR